MAHVTILDLNLATLRLAVDPTTYTRGTEYARQRAVMYAAWDPDSDALRGVVRGGENKVYNAAAFFSLTRGSPPGSSWASAAARSRSTASTWSRWSCRPWFLTPRNLPGR